MQMAEFNRRGKTLDEEKILDRQIAFLKKQYDLKSVNDDEFIYNKNKKSKQSRGASIENINPISDHSMPEEGQDSEEEEKMYNVKKERKRLKKAQIKKEAEKKMAVGTGFSFDITQFFKFKQRGEKELKDDDLFSSISGGYLSFLILIYSLCNAAIIPPWIMSIKANKILRISWRFLLQAIVMIPFVLYEKRTLNPEKRAQVYKMHYLLSIEGLKKVFLSSFGTTLWFTIILSCFEWTYISHALVLGSLSNFFLSINRSLAGGNHELEPGGQLFVVAGILFVVFDTWTLIVSDLPDYSWDVINTFYLKREAGFRILADLASLVAAYILSKFSRMAADLKSYYPPFLSMFLVNISLAVNVSLSGYFINGATFDTDTDFGIFGLFTSFHFASFLYMSIILSFGTFISFALISKLFTDPIIPALVMTLEPIFSTFFLNVAGVQTMPGSFSIFGYILVICGLFLILIGQCMFQRKKDLVEKRQEWEKELREKLLNEEIIEESSQSDISERQIKKKRSLSRVKNSKILNKRSD